MRYPACASLKRGLVSSLSQLSIRHYPAQGLLEAGVMNRAGRQWRLFMVLKLGYFSVLAVVAVLGGCPNGTTSQVRPAVEIAYALPTTIDGSNQFADVDIVGRKQVGLVFIFRKPVEINNVVLTYWRAGNNVGARRDERTLHRSFSASENETVGFTEYFEIPGGSDLQQCDALYYTFAAGYRVAGDANNGLF